MLLPAQIIPFLQHEDPIVRTHAWGYFDNTFDFGPLTADHLWATLDRFPENDDFYIPSSLLSHIPHTEASLQRLLQNLNEPAPEPAYRYNQMIRDLEMNSVIRHRQTILAAPALMPDAREYLELRLQLLDEDPVTAWDRLMAHGKELGEGNNDSLQVDLTNALIEAAARGGEDIASRAMQIFAQEPAIEDWREDFAICVLGELRHEPAIDAMLNRLLLDADMLSEDVCRALTKIGTPTVLERLNNFYPGKPWFARIYATGIPENIKHPQSVHTLQRMLEAEANIRAAPNDTENQDLTDEILRGFTQLASLAGLEASRQYIQSTGHDAELVEFCERLLATAIMNGVELPEEHTWRQWFLKQREKQRRAPLDPDRVFKRLRDMFQDEDLTAIDEDEPEPSPSTTQLLREADDVFQPYRRETPKVGRNDSCPCGSGKKYKKCCGA